MLDFRTLPFTRWNIELRIDEPAHGFYARLVEKQGGNSLRIYNQWVAINVNTVRPDQMCEKLMLLPLSDEVKARLRHNTPLTNGEDYELAGEVLNYKDVSFRNRRWCPACLAESAHHRMWWDIVAIRRCPYHCVELTNTDRDGHVLQWWWPSYVVSANGVPLANPVPRVIGGRKTMARYVLGRLGIERAVSAPLIDGMKLTDSMEACGVIGKLLVSPQSASTPDEDGIDTFDVGFRALCGSKAALAHAVRMWLRRNVPKPMLQQGAIKVFGWAFPKLSSFADKEFEIVVRRAFHVAHAFESAGVDREFTDEDVETRRVTRAYAAKQLGMERDAITIIGRRIGLVTGGRRRNAVREADIPLVEDFARKLIGPREVAKRLGIHTDSIRHLVHAGHLTVFRGLKEGERHGARYAPEDVDRIIERLAGLKTTGADAFALTFHTYVVRNKLTFGATALDILDGKVPIASIRSDAPGFKSLMIETDTPRRQRGFGGDGVITLGESQAILNMTYETVVALRDKGVLSKPGTHPDLKLLSREDVLAFAATHAKMSDFAAGLGMSSAKVLGNLRRRGFQPIVTFVKGGKFVDTVVRREDVMKAMELRCDPSVIRDDHLKRFWKALTEAAARACPKMLFPPTLPAGGQRVWSVQRGFSLRFEYIADRQRVTATLSPTKTGHSVWFDLRDPKSWDIDGLISTMIARMDEADRLQRELHATKSGRVRTERAAYTR